MVELKVEDKIDYSKLKRIAKTQRTILVGHADAKEAEIAKKLYFGGASPAYDSPRGRHMGARNIPARPYLTDGFFYRDPTGVEAGIGHYYEGLFVGRGGDAAQALANKIAQDVRDFVVSDNYYAETLPNGEDVIEDKGFNHPLVDQGNLMKSLVGKVILHGK
jgi:hypothetical protein